MHKAYIILLFVLSVAAGVASGHYFGTRAAANSATAIAVLDVKGFTDVAIKDVDPEEIPAKIEEGYKNAARKANALKERGFIVLNPDSIVAAPDYYMAHPAETNDDDS